MRGVIIMFLVCLVGATTVAIADSSDEEAVWGLEESYFVYVKNNDIAGYLTLWDERFVGWPCGNLKPSTIENIADWIPSLHADPSKIYEYELKREAVRSFGDIVVTHYLARQWFQLADTGEVLDEDQVRITHTWRRRGNTWQIITGMCGTWVGDVQRD